MNDTAGVTENKLVPVGVICQIKFVDCKDTISWYISLSDPVDEDVATDKFGVPDKDIAYYAIWDEILELTNPLNGNDFYILWIEEIVWQRVTS